MPEMTSIEAAGFWSGLLILLLVFLSVRVVMGRRRHRVLLGDGGVGEMNVTMRAFGNAAEYIPAGVAALILLALVEVDVLWIHVAGLALLAGRLIHPSGLKLTGGVPPARVVGMALTWLVLIGAGLALIIRPLVG